MILQQIKLVDDSTKISYQVFKCEKCDKFYIYFHGKLRDLEDMQKTEHISPIQAPNKLDDDIKEHFKEGSDWST